MKKIRYSLFVFLAFPLITLSSLAKASPTDCSVFEKQEEFITCLHEKYIGSKYTNMSRKNLQTILGQAEVQDRIIELISRPAEKKPWHEYRPLFVTKDFAQRGADFWKKNQETLQRAEETYGVPAEVIVAIIGIETRYGTNTGQFRVLDSLVTLGFNYPPRGKFFRQELEHFLLLTQEENLDPLVIRGSYAGAMGVPQFISSSYRNYAVNFSNSGQRDLFNTTDAIGSVAAYLKNNGWKSGLDVAHPAQVNKNFVTEKEDLRPKLTLADLQKQGVKVNAKISPDHTARVIPLEGKTDMEHWVGLHNFYVITTYNRSVLYAMSVHQLSEMIQQQGVA